MDKLSMSISPGDRAGRGHNILEEYRNQLEDIDHSRTYLNICLQDDDLGNLYHELFDDSLEKYNAIKREKGRANEQISDYLKHIKSGNQEQEAYELVFQFGDKDTFKATNDENRKLAVPAFKEIYAEFVKKYPNFHCYQAAIHLDESTPHLHIAYVPVFENYGAKRGLEVRTAHSKAYQQMGFKDIWELNNDMFQVMSDIGDKYGIEREIKNCTRKHLPVREYKAHAEEIKDAENYPYNNDPVLVSSLQYMAENQEAQAQLIEQQQSVIEHMATASVFEFKGLKEEAQDAITAQKKLFPEWSKVKSKMQGFAETIKSIPEKAWAAIIHPVGSEQRKIALGLDKDDPIGLEEAVRASVRASNALNGHEDSFSHNSRYMGR